MLPSNDLRVDVRGLSVHSRKVIALYKLPQLRILLFDRSVGITRERVVIVYVPLALFIVKLVKVESVESLLGGKSAVVVLVMYLTRLVGKREIKLK